MPNEKMVTDHMLKNITIVFLLFSIFLMHIRELKLEHHFIKPINVEVTPDGLKSVKFDPGSFLTTDDETVTSNDRNDAIIISGPISSNTLKNFQKLLTKDTKMVVIASPGGDLDAASAISKLIFLNHLVTLVPNHAMCYSACTLIFQAGYKRLAYRDSMFMYHFVKEENPKTKENLASAPATSLYWAYLIIYGIDEELLSQIGYPEYDYFVNPSMAVRFNIVTKLIG